MIKNEIKIAVQHILEGHPVFKYCTTCKDGCDDLTKFICFGFTSKDIEDWCMNNKEILRQEAKNG